MSESDRPQFQTNATNYGDGSVIVQVPGSFNRVSVELGSRPVLNLYSFVATKTSGSDPVSELTPYNRRSQFVGRDSELASLLLWLNDPAEISVRILIGEPGVGKTRLAIELAAVITDGWASGFLRTPELRGFVTSNAVSRWKWDRPTLVIVDYAAEKAADLANLLEALGARASSEFGLLAKLRFLLLERNAEPTSGWFSEVFASPDRWSGRGNLLLDPQQPVALVPIGEAAAIALLSNVLCRKGPAARPSAASILKRLQRSPTAEQLTGNPLMLQIAAVEGLHGEADSIPSRTTLLDAVVRRERGRMLEEWRHAHLPEYLTPYLLQLVAVVVLLHGADAEQIFQIIDSTKSLTLLRKSIDTAKIVQALKPDLREDQFKIRPIEPDLVADLFIAKTELSAEIVIAAVKLDPFTVGTRLWRILRDFGDDPQIATRSASWIRSVAESDVSSIALDMFLRSIGHLDSARSAPIAALILGRITDALKTGGDTAETLLAPRSRDNITSWSLLHEARAYFMATQYELALKKLGESKALFHRRDLSGAIDHDLERLDLELNCYKAVDNKECQVAVLDEGIAFCEDCLAAGVLAPFDAFTPEDEKSLFDKMAPGRSVLAPRRLKMIQPTSRFKDLRLVQANFVLQRIQVDQYPQSRVIVAAERCKDVLEGATYRTLLDEANYYQTKYESFQNAGEIEFSRVFRDTHEHFKEAARLIRSNALLLILALEKFIIGAFKETQLNDRRNRLLKAVNSFTYALDNNVPIQPRHLVQLGFCFILDDKSRISDQFFSTFIKIAANQSFTTAYLTTLISCVTELFALFHLADAAEVREKINRNVDAEALTEG